MQEADKVYSEYIRLSWAGDNGLVACYTCSKIYHWRHLDCGHFIKRQFTALRFNNINCKPQCKNCNNFLQGNDAEFERRLIAEYGADRVLWLKANQKKRKWSRWELRSLINDYYARVFDELKKVKGQAAV
jgi:hypothetical protein